MFFTYLCMQNISYQTIHNIEPIMSNKILIPVFITFTLFVSQTTQSNKYVLHHSQMQIMPRHTLLNNDSTPKSLEEIQREQGKIKNSRKNQRITHKKRQKQLRVDKRTSPIKKGSNTIKKGAKRNNKRKRKTK